MCYGGCDCARCNPESDGARFARRICKAEIVDRFAAGEGLAHLARLHSLTLLDVERVVREALKKTC